MAILTTKDYSLRSGKLNKKDDVIYRVRNGKQQQYIAKPCSVPPTRAQKSTRSLFGKINAIVNVIMGDPEQIAAWEKRRKKEGREFITTRQFVFASVSEQLKNQRPPAKRKKDEPVVLPRGYRIRIKPFAELTTSELYEILKVRFAVFFLEQGIRYLDLDNIDYTATHLAIFRRGQVIAYARLFADAESGVFNIGRLLSIRRGKGFGKHVVEQAVLEAKRQGASRVQLHAQLQNLDFFRQLGFKPVGESFIEADLPHICMQKQIL